MVNVGWFNLVSSFFLMIPLYFQIIVLEDGKVVEQGPHDFLLSQGGRYAELWYQQNSTDAMDSAAASVEV
jgi:ABC-type transport system involved in cytochrome bd biosynthesis fused ATPase/permease subunit